MSGTTTGPERSEVLKYLADTYTRFGIYHNHKEVSAWAGIVLWALIVPGLANWASTTRPMDWPVRTVITGTIIALGAYVWRYVNVQFSQRTHAADVIAACGYLSISIISGKVAPTSEDFAANPTEYRGRKDWHYLPRCVLAEIDRMKQEDRPARAKLEDAGRAVVIIIGLSALAFVWWTPVLSWLNRTA